MAQMPTNFDPSQVEASQPREGKLVPRAWYAAQVESSEIKTTRPNDPVDKQGQQLAFKCRIVEGVHSGTVFFIGFNIINPNPTAVKIAQSDLAALCNATGYVGVLDDSDKMHGAPFDVLLDEKAGNNGYGPRNEAKGFTAQFTKSREEANVEAQKLASRFEGSAPTQAAAGAAQAPPAAAGGSGAAPQAANAAQAPPATAPVAAQPTQAAPGFATPWGNKPPTV